MIRLPHFLAGALAVGICAALPAAVPTASAAMETPLRSSAARMLQALDVSSNGGKVLVKMKLKEPLAAAPATFALNNPPRIAFDLPNTVNALGTSSQEFKEGELRSVRVGQSSGRTRVVLNLERSARYDTSLDGQNLLVTLQAATASEPVKFADAKPLKQGHSVRAIDFKRGRNGEGQVIIDLSDSGTGIDLRQTGKTIVVDLLQTQVPVSLERRFDVNDFGTPVDFMKSPLRARTRLTISAKGRWEQSAYQTDNRFVVEVKPYVERQAVTQDQLQRREAVAELPERGCARRAAGDRRFHGLEHRHQRYRCRQPHPASEGRALGSGPGHHPAGQGSGHAQVR